MTYLPKILTAAVALGVAAPVLAHGNVHCNSGPQTGWKPIDTLKTNIVAKGWKIKKAKVERDCYEVYGTTPEGVNVEAFFHPVTLDRVLVLRRGKVLYAAPGYKP